MQILMGLIAIAVVIGVCYLAYKKIMVPNGDGDMPGNLLKDAEDKL